MIKSTHAANGNRLCVVRDVAKAKDYVFPSSVVRKSEDGTDVAVIPMTYWDLEATDVAAMSDVCQKYADLGFSSEDVAAGCSAGLRLMLGDAALKQYRRPSKRTAELAERDAVIAALDKLADNADAFAEWVTRGKNKTEAVRWASTGSFT